MASSRVSILFARVAFGFLVPSSVASNKVNTDSLYFRIEVIATNADNERIAEVYGTITASQTDSVTLFDRSKSEYSRVVGLNPIPLKLKYVTAKTSIPLTITADLWDHDVVSSDDSIAQGSVDFTVEPGRQSKYIHGMYGHVEVVITSS